MNLMLFISDLIIPLTIVGIVLYGIMHKTPVYDNFIEGAKDGLKISFNILPTLVGLMVGVGILRSSGALHMLANFISPLTNIFNFPADALPLTLMRLVSSSAATGLQLDIYANHGPDSFIGRFVSIMMSSTETVFYTFSLYFIHINIKKTRYTLAGALLSNLVSIIVSLLITVLIFG